MDRAIEVAVARLRALVRRAAGWADRVLAVGPYELDTASQQLRLEGEDIVLTAFEYKLAEYLILHAGRVVSKTELSEHVYAEDVERESNVIEVLLGRLRRKLDPERRHDPIETLRGRGYRFRYSPGADRA